MDVEDLVAHLVEIESTNPDLGPGTGEAEIADFVVTWLRDRGVEARLQPTSRAGRPNVIARVGSGRSPTLMLNGHLDTVGLGGMQDPLQPQRDGNRLRGRGALDTKGGLAALMTAAAAYASRGLDGTVLLTAVSDEEYASIGTEAVLAAYTADAAIVTEPSGLDLVIAHKGFVWFEIETRGVAAHGSLPDIGVDAIGAMGKVLVALDTLDAELAGRPEHPLLGRGSVHAGVIRGGQELSSYPARCVLGLERRTLPGESAGATEAEVEALLDHLRLADPGFRAGYRRGLVRDPYEIEPDHPLVDLVARELASVLGRPAARSGHGAWMDSALLGAAGIPSVVLGPAGDGLHGDEEWVDLESVAAMVRVVRGVIETFCG